MSASDRPSDSPAKSSSTPDAKQHIVIFGAGPIGLITAILLKKKGVTHITVLDPRAGIYTRPGNFNKPDLKHVADMIKESVPSLRSSHVHIKDLERWLFEIAKRLGIDIRQESFDKFVDNKTVETVKQDESNSSYVTPATLYHPSSVTQRIPCDLAIDATGPSRALIRSLNNRYQEAPPFHIEPAADNPIKNHFIAYVTLDDRNMKTMHTVRDLRTKNQDHAAQGKSAVEYSRHRVHALRELQEKFGWKESDFPQIHILPSGRNKICFYYEIPEKLPQDQYENWLKSLLHAITGDDVEFKQMKASRKYKKKPRFLPFIVDPHKVTPFVYRGDEKIPMVIPVGDALIEPYYAIAIGVRFGSSRVKMLVDCINVFEGKVILDAEQYSKQLVPDLDYQSVEMQKRFSKRLEKLYYGIEAERQHLKLTIQSSSDQSESTSKMQVRYQEIKKEIDAIDLYDQGMKIYESMLENKESIKLDADEKKINDSMEMIVSAISLLPPSRLREIKMMENQIFKMAVAYGNLGNQLGRMKKYDEAERQYQKALYVYANHLPNQHMDSLVLLHSNMVLNAIKHEKYDMAIKRSDFILEKMPEIKEKAKFMGRIGFSKLHAMLNKLLKEQLNNDVKVELYKKATDLLHDLKKNKTVSEKELKKVEEILSSYRPPDSPSMKVR